MLMGWGERGLQLCQAWPRQCHVELIKLTDRSNTNLGSFPQTSDDRIRPVADLEYPPVRMRTYPRPIPHHASAHPSTIVIVIDG